MKKINVFEAFAGIGAQHKSISKVNKQNKNVHFEVVETSDWDIYCNIAYAAIHNNLKIEAIDKILLKNNIDDYNKVIEYWKNRTFSRDSKNILTKVPEEKLLKITVASNILNNNYPDINKLKGTELDELNIDLLTYSFPCQGLSIASMGRSRGINDSESTSHLVWQIDRIISEMKNKPRFLLLENVKSLVKKYKHEYEGWINRLKKYNYKTFTVVLNAYDHGSLQSRERVYAISVLNNIETPFNNDEEFKNFMNNLSKNKKTNKEKRFFETFDIYNLKYVDEAIDCLMNNTPSRERMVKDNLNISDIETIKKRNYKFNTLTTKQDRNPNIGVIEFNNKNSKKLNYRFITPREAYKLMGFDENDYNKLLPFTSENLITKESLYRQAGNSIDICPLVDIFKVISIIEGENNE